MWSQSLQRSTISFYLSQKTSKSPKTFQKQNHPKASPSRRGLLLSHTPFLLAFSASLVFFCALAGFSFFLLSFCFLSAFRSSRFFRKSPKAQKHLKTETHSKASPSRRGFSLWHTASAASPLSTMGYANMLLIVYRSRCLGSWLAAREDPTWWRG